MGLQDFVKACDVLSKCLDQLVVFGICLLLAINHVLVEKLNLQLALALVFFHFLALVFQLIVQVHQFLLLFLQFPCQSLDLVAFLNQLDLIFIKQLLHSPHVILELWHRLYFLSVFQIDVEHVLVTPGLVFKLPGYGVVHLLAFFGLTEQILDPTEANISRFL